MEEREFLDLLARIRTGEDAREGLLAFVHGYLTHLANRHPKHESSASDASDVVQAAALVVVRRLGSFRGGSLGEFRAWLAKIFKSRMQNVRRYQTQAVRDESRTESLGDAVPVARDDTPSELLQQAEAAESLQRELLYLPEKQRIALRLKWLRFKSQQIAEILDEPVDTVRKLIRDGVHQLKVRLEEHP